jgi:hypothetical protein
MPAEGDQKKRQAKVCKITVRISVICSAENERNGMNEFIKSLRPGAVLNMSTRSVIGRLIRHTLAARSGISAVECPNHDAIVVAFKGQLWIGESQPPVARLTSIEDYIRDMERGFISRLRVLYPTGASAADGIMAAQWWQDNIRNSPYDYWAFPRLIWKALVADWWPKQAGKEWANWCTEGVANAWRIGAGIDPWKKTNPTPLTTLRRAESGGMVIEYEH